jgi:hypothetical protein
MPTIDVRLVECGHQKVQICSQCLHDCNLCIQGADNGGKIGGSGRVDMKPCWQRGVREGFEVAKYTLSRPSGEVLVDACGSEPWL